MANLITAVLSKYLILKINSEKDMSGELGGALKEVLVIRKNNLKCLETICFLGELDIWKKIRIPWCLRGLENLITTVLSKYLILKINSEEDMFPVVATTEWKKRK